MKIAFTGSHSTGKTTLLNDAKPILTAKGLSYVTEVARHIIQRGYPLNMDANVEIKDEFGVQRQIATKTRPSISFSMCAVPLLTPSHTATP